MISETISVIVPVYNGEKYLDRCISSIVNQTYKHLEIIIVDDGSIDNSGDICEKWKEKDERIVVIHTSNGGVSRARNIALDLARGEYIAFVDADDWIDVDMYDSMIMAMQKTNADICAGGHVLSISDKTVMVYENNAAKLLNRDEAIIAMYAGKIRRPLGWELWDKLFRRVLFDNLRFQCNRKVAEDKLLLWQIMKRVNNVYQIPLNKYYYFMREDSVIHNITVKSILDDVCVARHIYIDSLNENDSVINAVKMRYYITLISAVRRFILYSKLTKRQQKCVKKYSYIIRKNIGYILAEKCDFIYKMSAIYVCLPYDIKIILKKLICIYKARENLH